MSYIQTSLFQLGSVVITATANECLNQTEVQSAIRNHINGDWGDLDAEDVNANESALKYGGRIFSSYSSTGGIQFWIITEADRSSTTILLPEDY
jgi:hypothetical protein